MILRPAVPVAKDEDENMKLPSGVWPVMLTPFDRRGSIDWDAYAALIEFQITAGVAGLFAVCGSSEAHHLTVDEQVRLARQAVETSGGRVPVVGGAIGAESLSELNMLVHRMAETGVDAVVVGVNQLAPVTAGEREWRRAMEALLQQTHSIPLGTYECPTPYHRLLPEATVRWLAETGRFRFHKDTQCDAEPVRRKIQAVHGTSLTFLNAHTPTLLQSLRDDGDGYCGVGANFFPELYVALCRDHAAQPRAAAQLESFLLRAGPLIDEGYPASAKACLALRGMPITTTCRQAVPALPPGHRDQMLQLIEQARDLEALVTQAATA